MRPNLRCDVMLSHNLLKQHSAINLPFGGSKPALNICGVAFENLTKNCKPVAIESQKYSLEDKKKIKAVVTRMLREEIIKQSRSPWRAPVLITPYNNDKKKRMVIDYFQTINRFILLDTYPVLRINEMINEIAKYRIFNMLDLKTAYH